MVETPYGLGTAVIHRIAPQMQAQVAFVSTFSHIWGIINGWQLPKDLGPTGLGQLRYLLSG